RTLKVADHAAGRRVKCPACQQVVTVPDNDNGPQKKSGKMLLWLGLGAGAVLLGCCCLGGVGAGAYFLIFAGPKDKVLTALPVEEKGSWTASDPTHPMPALALRR